MSKMNDDARDLVRALKENPEALEKALRDSAECLRKGGYSKDTVDDALSEVWLKIYEGSYDGSTPLPQYALGVAKKKRLMELARKQALKCTAELGQTDLDLFAQISATVRDTAERAIPLMADLLPRAVQKVPEKQRALAVMKFIERKESREIADELGVERQDIRNALRNIAVRYIYPAIAEFVRDGVIETAAVALRELLEQSTRDLPKPPRGRRKP